MDAWITELAEDAHPLMKALWNHKSRLCKMYPECIVNNYLDFGRIRQETDIADTAFMIIHEPEKRLLWTSVLCLLITQINFSC
jgi:hypothetical protein